MSEASDGIDRSKVQLKKIAARLLAKKDAVDQQIADLLAQRERILEQLSTPEIDTTLEVGLEDTRCGLEGKLEVLRADHAQAEADYLGALQSLRELPGLLRQVERAELSARTPAVSPDRGQKTSAEDSALARVREHIAGLEAQVQLKNELDQAAEPAPANPEEPPEDADAVNRGKLEALKAKRRAEKKS